MTLTRGERTSHAVIAGTGRAGTTFLVQFLAKCGVPVGSEGELGYDEAARAGLECSLLRAGDTYLVKDPWLSEYLDQVDLEAVAIDALILPVRNLRHAAMSRVQREYENWQGHPDFGAGRGLWGVTPGGVKYSMSVTDQERILALHQATVLEWAVRHSLPLFLLHFPRLVHDADYLIDTLWPWLGGFCDRATAREAFMAVADPREWKVDESALVDADALAKLQAEVAAVRAVNERLSAQVAAVQGTNQQLTAEMVKRTEEAHAAAATASALRDDAEQQTWRADRLAARLEAIRSSRAYLVARCVSWPATMVRRLMSRGTRRSIGQSAAHRSGKPSATPAG